MSDDEMIEQLAALEAKATPGPWEPTGDDGTPITHSLACIGEDGCTFEDCDAEPGDVHVCDLAWDSLSDADTALIVAMRNALPTLIAMARDYKRVLAVEKSQLEDRDRYLAALKGEACFMGETCEQEFVTVGDITFRVTRKPDGSLEADEVK